MRIRNIAALAVLFALILCGCGTTPTRSDSSITPSTKPESVTVGGEIQIRGQYLK